MTPLFLLLSMGWLIFSTVAAAEEPAGGGLFGGRSVLRAGQVVHGDYIAVGPHVQISGTVHGDVYAAGGEVLVDGTVNGDLIVVGGYVTLAGSVSQDARLAGGRITISGIVGRNMTVGGGDIRLEESAQVRENLLAGGGEVQLAGRIGRDARIGAGTITIENGIERDAALAAVAIRLTSKATVGGKLRYWSETAPSIDEGATVRGGIVQRPLPSWWNPEEWRYGVTGVHLAAVGVSFVSTLVLGLLMIHVYPRFTGRVTATIGAQPLASAGWGLAALVGTPILAGFLLVTVIGLPLGILLLALYAVTVYLARMFAVTWLGRVLFRRPSDSPSLAGPFVVGLILYTVLGLIPYVGTLVTGGAVLFGLGSLLIAKKELVASLRARGEV